MSQITSLPFRLGGTLLPLAVASASLAFALGLAACKPCGCSIESEPPTGEFGREVVVLIAAQENFTDLLNTQFAALDPSLRGEDYIHAIRPLYGQYRDGLAEIRRQLAVLQPTGEDEEVRSKGLEWLDYAVGSVDAYVEAETEQQLSEVTTERQEEEDRLRDEFQRAYCELLRRYWYPTPAGPSILDGPRLVPALLS